MDKDKKKNEQIQEKIDNIDEDIEIKEVKYGYKELEAAKQKYDDKIAKLIKAKENNSISKEENALLENIVGCGITIEKNRVTVYMNDVSDIYKELFSKYFFETKIVRFEKEVERVENSATELKLGRAIHNPKYWTSIGLKAYTYNSDGKKVYGFITSGHSWKKGDNVYIDANCRTKIGKVIKNKNSGKVDASFVQVTNTNYVPSRVVYYSNSSGSTGGGKTLSTNYLYLWLTGVTVYKSGARTYLTQGKLTDYDYSCTVKTGEQRKNMYRAKIKSNGGDSGGVLYCKDGGEYCALGILSGSNDSGYAYFSKWQNIDDSFNIFFY